MEYILRKYDDYVTKICSPFSNFLIQVICFIVYKIMVDVIYVMYLGKTSGYGIEISVINILSGYLAVLLFSYFIVKFCENLAASSLIMIVINMIYFVPITTFCGFGLGSSSFLFFSILFWVFLSVFQTFIPCVSLQRGDSSVINKLFYALYIMMFALTIFISYKYTGFRIITSLLDVYETRAEAAAYDIPVWMSYVQHFSTIIIPMLILIALGKKKYLFVIAGCFLLLLNFSFAGHKSVLFMGILLILGHIFWREEMICMIMPGGIFLGLIGLLEYIFANHAYVISYFFRRQGYDLARLSNEYYKYFMHNPTEIFRGTFLGKIGFESPYKLPIAKVIGNNYESQIINCNNGLLADVWSHLGGVGIVIMPLILIVCFRLFDLVTDKINSRCFIGLAIYYAVMFCNTTWSTVLLTHGFLIMCVLFFLFPREREGKCEKK